MPPRRRILLIDDNANFREVFSIRLRAAGYEVETASSGHEGLQTLTNKTFDLILLDMLMPEKDGIATYQELRANPSTRQVPVILLTAVAVEGHWEPMPYETDGQAFIMGKPYDYADLLTRIQQVLGQGAKEGAQ